MILTLFLFILTTLVSCNAEEIVKTEPKNFSFINDTNLNDSSTYIIVIGDIQEYTNSFENSRYYVNTINWAMSQYLLNNNICCVLQTGDITNDGIKVQFESFYINTIELANRIPYIACIGNHDYIWDKDRKIADRNNTFFSQYVSFEKTKRLIVERFENDSMENIVLKISIGEDDVYVLVLEFGPRNEVIEWANDFVKSHKNKRFILMTHEYLTKSGQCIESNSYAELQLLNTTFNTPSDIWRKLIKDNDNIVCVLCGHNGFAKHIYTDNSEGRSVPQILFNLQYQENGGNGFVQLWEFPYNSDSTYVKIYDTINKKWYNGNNADEFSFRFKY